MQKTPFLAGFWLFTGLPGPKIFQLFFFIEQYHIGNNYANFHGPTSNGRFKTLIFEIFNTYISDRNEIPENVAFSSKDNLTPEQRLALGDFKKRENNCCGIVIFV